MTKYQDLRVIVYACLLVSVIPGLLVGFFDFDLGLFIAGALFGFFFFDNFWAWNRRWKRRAKLLRDNG